MKNLSLTVFAIICVFAMCDASPLLLQPVTSREGVKSGINRGSRIVNGYIAKPGQFPHMCSLINRKKTGLYTLCGGSVISERHIITAGHCVVDVEVSTAGCGTVDFKKPYLRITGSDFTIHPDYNPSNLNHNIAIWNSPIGIIFNAFVNAIRLPTPAQSHETFDGVTGTVSGFGNFDTSVSDYSQILRFVDVKVISNEECALIYGTHIIIPSMMCALGQEIDEQGTCGGDGGAPLYIQEGEEKTQIGVATFVSSHGCGSDRPTGYVRTASYLDWIHDVTGIPIREAAPTNQCPVQY